MHAAIHSSVSAEEDAVPACAASTEAIWSITGLGWTWRMAYLLHGIFKADDEVIRWKQRYLVIKGSIYILIYTQMSGVDMPQCLWKRTSIADVWVDMHAHKGQRRRGAVAGHL